MKVQPELLRNVTKRCDPDNMQALYQKHLILKAEHILEYWKDNYSTMTPEAIAYIKHRDLRWDPTIDARKSIARHDRAHIILKTADTDKFMTLIDMTAQHQQEHVRDYRKEHPKSTDYKALTKHLIKRIPAASTAIASLGHLSLLDQQEELQRRLAAAEQAEQHYLRLASELQFQSSQISALETSVSDKKHNRDKRRERNKYCFVHDYTSTHTSNECYLKY